MQETFQCRQLATMYYPTISAYLRGVGSMRNCPNSPMRLELAEHTSFYLNKYSYGIKIRTSGHWKFAQFPIWCVLCEFPMARASCYNWHGRPTHLGCKKWKAKIAAGMAACVTCLTSWWILEPSILAIATFHSVLMYTSLVLSIHFVKCFCEDEQSYL